MVGLLTGGSIASKYCDNADMTEHGLGTAARRGTPSVAPTKEVTREGSVVYYSMYGHVMQLARAVEEGAKSVAGADVILRRVKEFPEVEQATANNEFVVKIREQQKNVPIVTLDDLRAADAAGVRHPHHGQGVLYLRPDAPIVLTSNSHDCW